MIVGAAVVEVHVHGSRSLKQKRGVVRSIAQRVRNRFNLAVSEVGGQGTWQRAVLGIAACGIEPQRVRSVLERAISFIEELHLAEVRGTDIEIITLPYESNETGDEDEPYEMVDADWDADAGHELDARDDGLASGRGELAGPADPNDPEG
jgi:uncharacterized protein YlxP (DUF503 family)